MKKLIVIKMGGSVCTQKKNNSIKAKTKIIREIVREIKKAKIEKKFSLILVHGAGPFGHKLVKKYKIENGIKNKKGAEGFVRTHNSVEDLNKIITDIFREENLFGMPIQPSALIEQKNKKIIKFDYIKIKKMLEINSKIIPILYGDVVLDEKLKVSVVSGDAIISFIAKKLNARKVLFGTDVEGVLDYKGKLIPEINKKNIKEIKKYLNYSKAKSDVTGGMKGKINEIKNNLHGIETIIFDMRKKGNTYKALTNKKIGTIIRI